MKGFEVNVVYRLVDPKGLATSNEGNAIIVEEIQESGGTIQPIKVTKGNALGLAYKDGTVNTFASLWDSEVRYFEIASNGPNLTLEPKVVGSYTGYDQYRPGQVIPNTTAV